MQQLPRQQYLTTPFRAVQNENEKKPLDPRIISSSSLALLEEALSEFFQSYTSEEFAAKLKIILAAYSANDYYRGSSPSDVLFTMETFSDLVGAAYSFYQNFIVDEASNELGEQIMSSQSDHSPTPHFLRPGNFINISAFFNYQSVKEWQQTIKHLTFFALCKDNPFDAGYQEDTLFLSNSFNALVSDCAVIYQDLRS